MKNKKKLSVLERFLLPNPQWIEGYKAHNGLFGKTLGFLILTKKTGDYECIRLDRKNNYPFYASSQDNQNTLEAFVVKYCAQIVQEPDYVHKLPTVFKDIFGRQGAIFGLIHLGKIKGILILLNVNLSHVQMKRLFPVMDSFVSAQVELAYKNFELNNFYETVHPRALALSTMHSVHRVISSSLRLEDLLPRIGRLSAQVLKAKGCSILLVDATMNYLVPTFSFGGASKFAMTHKVKIGRGPIGRVASTGEFHFSRGSIAVPFIEDDVVGIIILWDKVDNQPFTKTDLEILKSLSEQAVVAIKNAQLFEETEKLTLGSIKAINELLELNFGGDRFAVPLAADVAFEIGKILQLSGKELTHLKRAIMLRDAGAMAIPDKLWQKKGKLTKKEFNQVKSIPMKGAHLLRSISSLKPVIPTILHHRERFDGKGYPQGLKGNEIPIGARIISVVDSFFAMISRTYREKLSVKNALKEIKANSGTQFDPRVVDAFFKVTRENGMIERIEQSQKQSQSQSSSEISHGKHRRKRTRSKK